MKTAIVTDTNSGMSAAEGRDRGIFILPMPVIIDAKTYKEGVDITNQEVFEAMQADRDISTSQPDLLSLENIWKEAFAAGYDEIVHIPMSSGLSGSCAMAQQMAMKYEGKVQVVDNHRISLTMYESVLDAKAMADAGKSAKEIRETLEEHGLEATIYLIVDTMKYLEKGGRITHGAAVMGSLFKIKPVLTIQGDVEVPADQTAYTHWGSEGDIIGAEITIHGSLTVNGTLKVTSANGSGVSGSSLAVQGDLLVNGTVTKAAKGEQSGGGENK